MSAVVSFLWPKNAASLERYAAQSGVSTVVAAEQLPGLLTSDQHATIAADAATRAAAVSRDLANASWGDVAAGLRSPHETLAATLVAGLETKMRDAMTVIAALDALHAREPVELVVLNEDVMQNSKTAAAWAKSRGVPTLMASHSTILGRLYTVHRQANADTIGVFGERGKQPYVDMGVDPSRLVVTGNPAWDVYASLVPQRAALRGELAAQYGFAVNDHLVVFATTWSANFTAFCESDAYATSIRDVVRAVAALREEGVPMRLVIKDRPSNAGANAVVSSILQAENADAFTTYTQSNLERWIVAADAVISVDSNVSIEATIAGVPAINLWSEMSWLNGPFFGAEDGVVDAAPENLANAIAVVLGDRSTRASIVAMAQSRLPEFTPVTGSSVVRLAELMLARRGRTAPPARRFAWEELSNPRSHADKGGTQEYYHNPRPELINLLRHEPRRVLEVGCADGSTGALLKQRYPAAHYTGIELNAEAAKIASGRLDRVLSENVEKFDFAAAGFAPKSIDAVFFADVLEHLYDPWNLLKRLRPFLADDAQILASIPNVRNMWLMNELIEGKWQYLEEGLLDVTHIRFFTKQSVIELFNQTGYNVQRMLPNFDPRVPAPDVPENGTVTIDTPRFTFKNVTAQEMYEYRTLQFLVDATPV